MNPFQMGGIGIASKLLGGDKKKTVYRDKPSDTQVGTVGPPPTGASPYGGI